LLANIGENAMARANADTLRALVPNFIFIYSCLESLKAAIAARPAPLFRWPAYFPTTLPAT
jgi:hypothetical protein